MVESIRYDKKNSLDVTMAWFERVVAVTTLAYTSLAPNINMIPVIVLFFDCAIYEFVRYNRLNREGRLFAF